MRHYSFSISSIIRNILLQIIRMPIRAYIIPYIYFVGHKIKDYKEKYINGNSCNMSFIYFLTILHTAGEFFLPVIMKNNSYMSICLLFPLFFGLLIKNTRCCSRQHRVLGKIIYLLQIFYYIITSYCTSIL